MRASTKTRAGVFRPRQADYELIRLVAARWGVPLNHALRQMLPYGAVCWLEADLANRYWLDLEPRYDRRPAQTRRAAGRRPGLSLRPE